MQIEYQNRFQPVFLLAFTVAFLLAVSTRSLAQEAPSGPAVRFAVSALPADFGTSICFLRSKTPVECPLSLHRFSPSQALAANQTELHLYQRVPVVSEETGLFPAPDYRLALPKARRIIVVVFPGSRKTKGSVPFSAVAIDESTFTPGSIYFFNPTPIPVGARLGKDWHVIEDRTNRLYQPAALDEGTSLGVQISLKSRGQWKLFASTRWHLTRQERHFVFFKINQRTGKPDYDSFTDYLDEDDLNP